MGTGIIAFLAARIGLSKPVLILIAIVACVVMIGASVGYLELHFYNRGFAAADAQWKARALQSKIDAANSDKAIAQASVDDAQKQIDDLTKTLADEKLRSADYAKQLQGHSAPDCALTDDDLRGLRAQSGQLPDRPAKEGFAAKARRLIRGRTGASAPSR